MSDILDMDAAVAMLVKSDNGLNKNDDADQGADDATDTGDEEISHESDPDLDLDLEDGPEGAPGDEVDDDEGDDEADEDQSLVEMPEFWDAEDKARFAALDPKSQKLVAEHARKEHAAVARKITEADTARNVHVKAAQELQTTFSELTQLAQTARQKFVSQWDGVDFAGAINQGADPIQVAQARIKYDEDLAVIKTINDTLHKSEAEAMKGYVAEQSQILTELAMKDRVAARIVDPVNGPNLRKDVFNYLVSDNQYPERQVNKIGARDMLIAYKAMMYDRAQAAKETKQVQIKSAPSGSPKTSISGMKPSAQTTKSTVSKGDAVMRRFNQTGSMEDAVAALMLLDQKKNKR